MVDVTSDLHSSHVQEQWFSKSASSMNIHGTPRVIILDNREGIRYNVMRRSETTVLNTKHFLVLIA